MASDSEARICADLAPRIRVFARRHLRDSHAADDFTQQILLTLIEALREGRIQQPDRLGSYVLGICRVALRDGWRNARRREGLFERHKDELVPDAAAPAEAEVALDAERLERCLEKLGERDRAVLVMTFYANKAAPEIAADLGLSAGNVRVVRHRALARLNECVRGSEREAS